MQKRHTHTLRQKEKERREYVKQTSANFRRHENMECKHAILVVLRFPSAKNEII